jgi:hypothetical protein
MLNYTGSFVIVESAAKHERDLSRKDKSDEQKNLLATTQGSG